MYIQVPGQKPNNEKYIFIYRGPDGVELECEGDTYEKARDNAQSKFFVDFSDHRWEGVDISNAIYPKPGTISERTYNMIHVATQAAKDETASAFIDEPSPSADESVVKSDGYTQFMDDVCNDDAPGYEETNDAMDKLTEDMNPPKPMFGPGSDAPTKPAIRGDYSNNRTVESCTVSQVAKKRQAKHDEMLADIGIARSPQHISITRAGYERGKTVIDLGYGNLEASRTEHDNKPSPEVAVPSFIGQFRKEQREDIVVPLSELRMQNNGDVIVPGVGTLGVEKLGFGQLLSTAKYFEQDAYDKACRDIDMHFDTQENAENSNVGYPDENSFLSPLYPRALSLFMKLDPDVRAYVFNEHMKRHGFGGQHVKLRTRVGSGPSLFHGTKPSIFSAVSPSYTTYDADEVAEFLGNALTDNFPDGMFKVDMKYNARTTNFTMDATMHAPSDLTDFSAGDLYKVGYRFKSNDVGGGGISGNSLAFWNECLNMIILSSKVAELVRVVHKGNVGEKMEKMLVAMEASKVAMQRFAVDWGILGRVDTEGFVFKGERIETTVDEETGEAERAPVAMLKALVASGSIGKGLGRDAAVQLLLQSYDNQGGGDTVQDIINAVTRMAHESLVDDCVRDGLERQAGALVPVLVKSARVAQA